MSRKRAAPAEELEDEFDGHQDDQPSKRARTNGHARDDDDDDIDSVDDQDAPMNGRRADGEHDEAEAELEPEADAFGEDGDEVDELDEQSEDEAMREEIRTQQADARDCPAEAGVVDKVDLKNFMCHRHLTMRLGQQLTFIIGHNGRITIALGGKAASTNRGSSLKSFVREGADSAEVILTMRNEGVEAFKPDLYGKRIIIERRIMAQGGTSWKLKNHAGKVVSTKREEIDAYCDHTNIQVDNPMNVLSQDAARQFLSSSHAKDKYSFFLKGTQLTQLADEYERIGNALKQMQTAVAKHEETIPDLHKSVREAMLRYKQLDKARSQKEQLIKLQEQMVWSQVIVKEQEVKKQRAETEKAKEKLNLVREEIEKHETALEELDAEIQEVEDRAKASREREAPLKEERLRLGQEIRTQMARIAARKDEVTRLNEQFTQYEQDVKRLQKEIDDEAARLAQDNREKIKALQDERKDCNRQLDELRADEAEMRQKQMELERETLPLRSRFDEFKREMNAVQSTIADKQSQLNTMSSSRKERLMLYGPSILHVLRDIDNYNGWRKKPLGPLGRYVKLREQRWSTVIETVLSNLLTAFVVSSFDDRQVLQQILNRNSMNNVNIIIAPDEQFDFSAGEPDPTILTIRRALEVTEPAVLCVLVNAAKIEKVALAPTRLDGQEIVRRNLRNVAHAFTADLFRVSGGVRGSSTQTLTQYRGAHKLTTNVDDSIRRVQEELRQAEQHKIDLDRQLADHRKKVSENEKAKADIKNKLPGIGRSIRRLDQRIQQIEEDLREDEPANVAALQENKEEATREQAKVVEDIQRVIKEVEEAEAALKPLSTESEKIKRQILAFVESRETFTEKLEAKTPQRMKVFSLLQHRKDQLDGKEREHEQNQFKLGQLEAELEDWTAQATEFCPRVEAPLKPEEYSSKISALEKHAAMAKKRGIENIDDVLTELKSKQQSLRDATEQIEQLRDVCKLFSHSITRRQQGWVNFQKLIAMRARNLFTMHLEHRGYTGSLSFDHEKHTLRLRVQTEDMTKVRRDKDPKSLSGGEKSFATICLLLALWEAIGCPIRCLDEFDVFMDAVNRKISMKMIAETAKKNPATQFVLITPQNMANVNFGPEVRVVRMSDPERGQGVLQAGTIG
ncbi:Structural maintenance of chromosomes protein 6 [Tilletia horrida]|nr:Structural maintenance of chromosomes protein 6 [Tilletia horrida]